MVNAQMFIPDPDWRFENFNSQNHFVTQQIMGVTMDNQGYVWTSGHGAQRFDGHKTVLFSSVNATEHPLKNDYAPEVVTDKNGRVWLSAGGLCYYDNMSGKFIYVQPPGENMKIDYAYAFRLQGNYLWFVSQHGLSRINVSTLEIWFTSLKNVTDPICTYPIDDHTFLVSSRQRVFFYNTKNDTYTAAILTYKKSLIKIFAVVKRHDEVFLGTNKGLFMFKGINDITFLSDKTSDLEIDDLLFMPNDKEKNYLFLATDGKGLMVYNVMKKKVEFTYTHDENTLFSLPCDIILKLFTDKSGRLLIATQFGVSMLNQDNQQWKARYIDKKNSGEQSMTRIAADVNVKLRVWAAAENIGMISLDWKTKKIEKIYNTNPEMRRIVDFMQVSADRWLLANSKKIIEWSPGRGVLSEMKLPLSDSLNLSYYIRKIIRADGLNCFITTNHGLFKYNLRTRKITVMIKNDNFEDKRLAIQYDFDNGFYDNGQLWIASKDGLFNYNLATNVTQTYHGRGASDNFMHDATPAPGNKIVCALGEGISIFDIETKSFTIVHTIANLFEPPCFAVTCRKNKVWIGSAVGVLTYDLEKRSSARIESGNSIMEISPACPFAEIADEMVIGVEKGYAYFKPEATNRLMVSSPVIESLLVNNRRFSGRLANKALRFKYSENSVDITFTAFLYNSPELVRFRYQLKGADKGWQYVENQQGANYAQLEPGDYTFCVQSGDKNGRWNNKPAYLHFIIAPPFWATWWFRGIIVLLIASILYQLYQYKIRHIKDIESIRQNIASDFHDDLGSTLSSISIFSEVASQKTDTDLPGAKNMIDDIGARARAMIHSMNDMVWTIKPENDNLYKLMQRMEEFGYPVAEAKEIQLVFLMDESLYNIKTDMVRRKNLFLIFKEAFNNAVKYSNAGSIHVRFKLNHTKVLVMQVTDNGYGFKYESRRPGNGLANMHKRTAEIKGKLAVNTAPGKGTNITIICKIA